MKQAKHDCQIKYAKENQQTSKQKNRKRNIIWYNPSFNNQVSRNIGKEFFKLLTKCFPNDNKLFSKNNVKISYGCTKNMRQIIKAHNAEIINGKNIIDPNRKTCNCRQPTKCPLDGNCLSSCIRYKATVSSEEQVAYIGLTSTTLKKRCHRHNKSFNHEKYENETELSKYVLKLEKKNSKFSITWKIISHATTKRRPSNQRNFCLEEKYQILKHSEKIPCLLINKRFEIRACNRK